MTQRDQILDALDILMEDLTAEQIEKLGQLAHRIRDPNNLNPNEAVKIVEELGIDIEALQKKSRRRRAESKPKKIKVGANEPCLCGSGKKWKRCCRDKQTNQP